MSAITVQDVWVEYGDQIVLERINLEIASGAFVSIVGPSGCGKSTFLRMVLGQERPTRGSILLDGAPLPEEPGPDRGVVFQRYSVFPHLTVLGNVLIGFEFAASPILARLSGAGAARGDRKKRSFARRRRAWTRIATSIRARSRAACSSASPSRRRWRANRGCCCSTSRSARSIPARAPRCTR